MNAEEARRLTFKAQQKLLEKNEESCFEKIRLLAETGDYQAYCEYSKSLEKLLKSQGFVAKQATYDKKQLRVSWELPTDSES